MSIPGYRHLPEAITALELHLDAGDELITALRKARKDVDCGLMEWMAAIKQSQKLTPREAARIIAKSNPENSD